MIFQKEKHIMAQNTGKEFEEIVFNTITKLIKSNQFMLSEPYIKVIRNAKYYSKDREANIICDISVEKYLEDPDSNPALNPAIIVVVECKDYSGAVPVDDVEEFHSKLQQIGADNTKGIMITHTGGFQRSALNYAHSKGIPLARILPNEQVSYVLNMMLNTSSSNISINGSSAAEIIQALTQKGYCSKGGKRFYSLTGDNSLDRLMCRLLT